MILYPSYKALQQHYVRHKALKTTKQYQPSQVIFFWKMVDHYHQGFQFAAILKVIQIYPYFISRKMDEIQLLFFPS